MGEKIVQGVKLPPITLRLVDGNTLKLPDELPGRYLALLFYRGTWCPYCKRQLASYQAKQGELESAGVTVVAAAVDPLAQTKEMVESLGLTFPVAYGVTDADVTEYGPWFGDDQHGHYIQPMELIVLRGGTVFGSMYASGPVGRIGVEEVLDAVQSREGRRLGQAQER